MILYLFTFIVILSAINASIMDHYHSKIGSMY